MAEPQTSPLRDILESDLQVRISTAMEHVSQFFQSGELIHLELAIKLWRGVVEVTPDGHTDRALRLYVMGILSNERYKRSGDPTNLQDVIGTLTPAVDLTPNDASEKPPRVNLLGSALLERFECLGNLQDLQSAVTFLAHAVDITPSDHPDKLLCQNNLGNALQARFTRLGALQDLQDAVEAHTRVIELAPTGHAELPSWYNNLGNALQMRFIRLGNLSDLQDALSNKHRAAELTPDGHPDKPKWLSNLGVSLRTGFERIGNLQYLQDAIAAHTRAVALITEDHPDRPKHLNNLGLSLGIRFTSLGDIQDLDDAITAHNRAAELALDGHIDKPSKFNNLGMSLWTRYKRLGSLQDLQDAIAAHTRAVELTPEGHSDIPSMLNNLAMALHERFERLGNSQDLQDSIQMVIRSVELTPDTHSDKPARLSNLGNALYAQFNHAKNAQDIHDAVAAQRRAVDLTPDGHPDTSLRFMNLGVTLQARSKFLSSLQDVEDAITAGTRAVELTPDSHPDEPLRLHNLGTSLRARFQFLGDPKDINDAVGRQKRAIELTPVGHAQRTLFLYGLGLSMASRVIPPSEPQSALPDDLIEVLNVFTEAAREPTGSPYIRSHACAEVIRLLAPLSISSDSSVARRRLLEAFDCFLDLVPQIIWLGNSVRKRYADLVELGAVANTAAACAIMAGDHVRALEWLESGRSIVWAQILQLRTPLDDLRHAHPQLVSELELVSEALQHASSITSIPTGETLTSAIPANAGVHFPIVTLTQQAHDHIDLAIKRDNLIAKIRQLDGFENFLCPKKLPQLIPAAADGPVVVINVDNLRCDALILFPSGEISHVPLPAFSLEQVKELHEQMHAALNSGSARHRYRDVAPDSDPEGSDQERYLNVARRRRRRPSFQDVLATLWTAVVKPISDKITSRGIQANDGVLPRYTWCPTGPLVFLPLHAAGIYTDGQRRQTIMDVAICSYTPTLGSLLKPRMKSFSDFQRIPDLLVVSQPYTPYLSPIPKVREEAALIRSLFGEANTEMLDHTNGTIDAVLKGMENHPWIHLACHGIQDSGDPTKSAFALYDGRLELSRLMSKSLPHAELAVLSACETATGDSKLPEEAIHLTAGMLSVGYRSVIGTMWFIKDADAPLVAERLYEGILNDLKAGWTPQPARALHEATKLLRETVGESMFIRWVPFVHFGI